MNLKLIEDDCRKKSPDVQGWAQKSLADRVHILLGDRTLDGNTLEEWEQLATTLSREIRVAEKTIAGGTKGHVPDDSTSDPEVMDMIKYVVHEVEAINQVCETNKVGRCDWENLSLAGRIAAIAANQATPELQKKINDGVWALNSHYGIPKDFTPVDQMNVIIQGLEIIDKDVNNVPFVNDDWRAIPLADRVNTIVSQRHKFDQESDNPSERLLDLLMTSIYDLRPAKGIRSDPTGIQYAITIISELTSIEQAVNSTVDQSSTGEFGKWRIRNLADRVQSIATDYTSITNRFDAALKRLRVELKALPVGPSRDRAIAILLKVFPEELANAKKEKPEEPEEPWHPTIDPDA
jgi:hypothetical protein